MVSYLKQWLMMRAGAAPVWVAFADDSSGHSYIMTEIDETGVVLAMVSSPENGVAYPWTAIQSIMPERHK